jgi:hypothetical protein
MPATLPGAQKGTFRRSSEDAALCALPCAALERSHDSPYGFGMRLLRRPEIWLCRWAVNIALQYPSPHMIPIGSHDPDIDYMVVQAGNAAEEWPFLVDDIGSSGICARWWDGESYSPECSLPNQELHASEFRFRHFIRTKSFVMDSALSFCFQEAIRWPYISVNCDEALQALFNTREVRRNERMKVLGKLVDCTCENRDFGIDAARTVTLFHSVRTWSHPQLRSVVNYYDLILNSLVVTKDLARRDHDYGVEPQALSTISEYECEERRHRTIARQQALMTWLTVVLTVIGALQAWAMIAALLKSH